MKFSIVVPAHNEATYIGDCLDSIEIAGKPYPDQIETVVVLNRCEDGTEEIAREKGAVIVRENARNLPQIRNAGLAAACGDIVCTLDADSRVYPDVLQRIEEALSGGDIIGGGVNIDYDRSSAGIRCTMAFLNFFTWITGLAAGMFWARREDWLAVGGYDENVPWGEDIDFARRLRILGKERDQRFIKLPGRSISTSSRKFDHFGDWYFYRMILFEGASLRRGLRGDDTRFGDKFFFDFNTLTDKGANTVEDKE